MVSPVGLSFRASNKGVTIVSNDRLRSSSLIQAIVFISKLISSVIEALDLITALTCDSDDEGGAVDVDDDEDGAVDDDDGGPFI